MAGRKDGKAPTRRSYAQGGVAVIAAFVCVSTCVSTAALCGFECFQGCSFIRRRPDCPYLWLQVETTVSKGFIRVSTTALGGAIAVGVMAHPTAATNPYLLTAVLAVFDFGVCLFMLSKYKYAGAQSGRVSSKTSRVYGLGFRVFENHPRSVITTMHRLPPGATRQQLL